MQCAQKRNKNLSRQGLGRTLLERVAEALRGTLPLIEWPCCPFSSTGLGSLCEFVSSQPQCCRQTLQAGDRVNTQSLQYH